MRLRTLEIVRVQGAVAALAGAAAGLAQRTGLLVRLRDADGDVGHGEASPLPGYSPDTIDACAQQLAAVNVDALPPPDEENAVDWVERALAASGVTAPAARFGLETALLDWLGQQRGHSVAALLGARPGMMRPLAALVADPDTHFEAARAAYARGIRTFKLKVGPTTFDDDLRRAQALRDALGTPIALRFDANGRLAPAQAQALLHRLAHFAPEFVEEPVAWPHWLQMHEAPVPLAADESLVNTSAWPALAAVCRVVVLKPTLLGGLAACLRLARDAAARGLAATVTHAYDGPVALAAAAELAAALPGTVLACGLAPHPALAAWPQTTIPQLQAAHIGSADRPGLGGVGLAFESPARQVADRTDTGQ